MLYACGRPSSAARCHRSRNHQSASRKLSKEPKPFVGRRLSPIVPEHEATPAKTPPPAPPDPMPPTHRRPTQSRYLQALLAPYGLSLSRLAQAGPPARQWASSWRSLESNSSVRRARATFEEHHGTLFHGQQALTLLRSRPTGRNEATVRSIPFRSQSGRVRPSMPVVPVPVC